MLRMRRRWKWLVGVPIAVVLAVVAATFVYIRFVKDTPERLTLEASGPPATAASSADSSGSAGTGIDGTWTVTTGSQAGYRVEELLFGQSSTAVGRTSDVEGTFVIEGTTVKEGEFTVDMTTVRSDQSMRDDQFNGRVMDVARYPTSTFTLTQPIDLGSLPADGQQITTRATGRLTLRGTTKTVTIDLQARRNGNRIDVASTIPIKFEEWQIPNPSFGSAETEDHGEIELLLVFEKSRA
jgi:polyisoprenoid-binding protein YceI